LRAAVQEEAVKAEASANAFGAQDIEAARKVWTQNGGQIITLSPQDDEAFMRTVKDSAATILRQHPTAQAQYDRYVQVAQKFAKA
jgi:hypothetical protein